MTYDVNPSAESTVGSCILALGFGLLVDPEEAEDAVSQQHPPSPLPWFEALVLRALHIRVEASVLPALQILLQRWCSPPQGPMSLYHFWLGKIRLFYMLYYNTWCIVLYCIVRFCMNCIELDSSCMHNIQQ